LYNALSHPYRRLEAKRARNKGKRMGRKGRRKKHTQTHAPSLSNTKQTLTHTIRTVADPLLPGERQEEGGRKGK